MSKPIFYDPQRARWKRLRRMFDAAGIALSLLVVFFVISALRQEPLPDLLLSPQKRAIKAYRDSRVTDRAKERLKQQAKRRKSKLAPSQVTLNQQEGIRAAFYVPWDAASFSSLRDYDRQIDLLYPDWLHVLTTDGRVQAQDDQTNKFFDVIQEGRVMPVDDRVMPFLKSDNTTMEVFPMVNNFDGAQWVQDISGFLNSEPARARFRREVAQFLGSDHFRGLMVDFEDFQKEGQPGYQALLQELSSDLHARGMKLYVSVPPHNEDYDYPKLAAAADGVVVMN